MQDEGEEKVEATTNAGTGPEPAPAPAGPQVVRRPLTRSRTSRMFAGVAGGMGEYFGVDPVLIRIAFAVLTLAGGAGVGLYLAAWLLIPLEGDAQSVGEEALAKASSYIDRELGGDKDRSWLWITLLVIGGLIVISNLGRMGWYEGAWFWAILLIAGGVWLYRQDTYGPRTPDSVAPERPVDPAVYASAGTPAAATPAGATSATTTVQPLYTPRPAPRVRPVKIKAPRSHLSRYTFAIGLIAIGTMAMLDNAGTLDVDGGHYAAAALTTAGVGLLVGSVWGRGRNLIFWGLLLVPFVLVADATDIPFAQGSVGERIFDPTEVDQILASHEMFAGHMVFDLSDLEFGSEPVEIDASVFMGLLEVYVPEGVDVEFRGHVEMGGVELFDVHRTGGDVTISTDESDGGPLVVLNTDVFMGEVVVHRTNDQAKEI
jgi:phage shock protein PspC (stress-responsive transcriptional regulator)